MHPDNLQPPQDPVPDTAEDSFSGDAWMLCIIGLAFFLILRMA